MAMMANIDGGLRGLAGKNTGTEREEDGRLFPENSFARLAARPI
jgi:hypothetical protein